MEKGALLLSILFILSFVFVFFVDFSFIPLTSLHSWCPDGWVKSGQPVEGNVAEHEGWYSKVAQQSVLPVT